MPAISQNPAHLHLLISHIPIICLAVAALGLVIAGVTRNRGAQVIALAIAALTYVP